MKKLTIFVLVLLISIRVSAGTWGYGSFENDQALDWSSALQKSSGSKFLLKTIRVVFKGRYIDAYDCVPALAGAEVVASLKDGNKESLPELVVDWLEESESLYEPEMAKLALKAIDRCRDLDRSELAQLWGESGSKEWLLELQKLINRLE